MKSGVTLDTLIKLVHQCDNLHVDLEIESKLLRSIVSEAIEWIELSADILEALGIPIISIPMIHHKEGAESTSIEVVVGYSDLKKLIDSANHISIQFFELRFVHIYLN